MAGKSGALRRRGLRLAAGCVVATASLLVLAPAAGASTALIAGTQLIYNAAAAEANNVTVSRDGVVFRITDPGAPITPTAPCVAVTANEVTCPATGITTLSVNTLDGNDAAAVADSVANLSNCNVNGGTEADTLNGGAGQTCNLSGGDGNDILNAGAHGDRFNGGDGNDVESGGSGNDSFTNELGDDVYSGNAGPDFFSGGSTPDGADTFSGGAGRDTLNYISRSAPLTITEDGVADDGEAGEGDNVMPDFERIDLGQGADSIVGGPQSETIVGNGGAAGGDSISGGGGNDLLIGTDANDALNGDAGDDRLFPSGGANTVNGGGGDDTLFDQLNTDPGSGADTFSGGPGSDTYSLNGAAVPVRVTLDGVADDGVEGENDNALPDVENAIGGQADDVLVGNDSANQFDGGGGADSLSGLAGDDGLIGGRGDDALDGGEGRDLIDGGSGADNARSRDSGPDEVSCGAGADSVLADRFDVADADCEALSAGVVIASKTAKLSSSGATSLSLQCPALEGVACAGAIRLVPAGKRKAARAKPSGSALAKAKFTIASGGTTKAKLKLTATGRKAVRGRASTPVQAVVQMTDATGVSLTSTARVVLHRGSRR